MRAKLRVVFDTNAFTPSTFDLLERGPMRSLCKSRRIVPIYGHVFLEETFRAYGAADKRKELIQRWIPFITETVDQFCDDFIGIWHKELVQGLGTKANIFMRTQDQKILVTRLKDIPLDGSWTAWHTSMPDRNAEAAKRAAQREISKNIRTEVADWRKVVNYSPRTHGVTRLDRYLRSEIEFAGRTFLPAVVKCLHPQVIVNRWRRNMLN